MEGNKDQLANNREAALKHLEITGRNLANKEFVKEEYQSTLHAYLAKRYLLRKMLTNSKIVAHSQQRQ